MFHQLCTFFQVVPGVLYTVALKNVAELESSGKKLKQLDETRDTLSGNTVLTHFSHKSAEVNSLKIRNLQLQAKLTSVQVALCILNK